MLVICTQSYLCIKKESRRSLFHIAQDMSYSVVKTRTTDCETQDGGKCVSFVSVTETVSMMWSFRKRKFKGYIYIYIYILNTYDVSGGICITRSPGAPKHFSSQAAKPSSPCSWIRSKPFKHTIRVHKKCLWELESRRMIDTGKVCFETNDGLRRIRFDPQREHG